MPGIGGNRGARAGLKGKPQLALTPTQLTCTARPAMQAQDDKEGLDRLVLMNTRLVALCANHDSVQVGGCS